jgi:hypothetical protein
MEVSQEEEVRLRRWVSKGEGELDESWPVPRAHRTCVVESKEKTT